MHILSFTLIIILLSLNCGATKITDRWEHLKRPPIRCIFAFSDILEPFETRIFEISGVRSLANSGYQWLEKANCTIILSELKEPGHPDSNGSYDGFIGAIQRDEIDSGYVVVRADILPYEPGKLTVPITSADVAVISTTVGTEESIERDVMSFLDLELPVRLYTLIGLFFLVPLILVCDDYDRKDLLNPVAYIRCYLNNCNMMLSLLLDQEQFSPRHIFAHILALTSSLFILFAVFGVLLNTVGANLVVKRSPHRIDTLDDLLASNRTPMVLNTFFAYRAIQSAPHGSKLYQLKQKMNQRTSQSIVNVFEMKQVQQLQDKMIKNTAVLLLMQKVAENIMGTTCFMKGLDNFEDTDRLHLSSESFASGVVTGILSNRIHPYAEKILSYLFITSLETGLILGLIQGWRPYFPQYFGYPGMKYNINVFKCMDKIREIKDQQFVPFSILHMKHIFILWAAASILAYLLLLFELNMVGTKKCDLNERKKSSLAD